MFTAEATKFPRIDGTGYSVEYRDADRHTLAFVDYEAGEQFAAVTVFDPSTGRTRSYSNRPAGRAFQIAITHLSKLGYVPGDIREIDADTAQDEAAADLQELLQPQLEPAVPIAAGAMGPFPAPPVPVSIPYMPATTSPAPAAAGETAGEWQGRVQRHFNSVAEAADAVLGEPAEDIVRHWISGRGTIYQLHLRAMVPAQETADALRAFVDDDAHGYTCSADGRIWLWSSHAWNVGYAVVLPA